MLFGTAKKLNKINEPFSVKFRDSIINETKSYNYLGNEIDPNVNLNKNFDKQYKKATGRMRLLRKAREYLTQDAALQVYSMSDCSLVNILLSGKALPYEKFIEQTN